MARVIGVDVGGTFTDIVIHDGESVKGVKVPTTVDQADGVVGAVDWRGDDTFLHGTTAATNALLEERGAKVALLTNAGFEDLLEIARQDRPSLYDSRVDRPAALVTREGRVGLDDLETAISRIEGLDPEVVVVGLVEGYRDPSVERDLADSIRGRLRVPVIESTEISPEFREYERIATAVLSGYLTPSIAGYLTGLSDKLGTQRLLAMTSAGGLLPFDQGAGNAARLVLSGPAGGVVAAAAVAAHHGYHNALSFDMGGTSTDVCRISGGVASVSQGHRIAGRVNRVPSLPVRTIGAGGGSIGWVDAGGALRVGPVSAGAIPGPAAYGKGGQAATVTDANVLLGHIPHGLALGGSLRLDPGLAVAAISRLAVEAGIEPDRAAVGILDVVDSHMEHALRAVSVEEGADPREAVLIAFGGAGGLHSGRLARALGIPRVLVPPLSGVFSAIGLLLAPPRADAARTVMLTEGDDRLAQVAGEVAAEATRRFEGLFGIEPGASNLGFDCRYAGQSHEVGVATETFWPLIRSGFEEAHLTNFGFARPSEPMELVNIRAVATGPPPLLWEDMVLDPPSGAPQQVDGAWQRSTLPAGFSIEGPALAIEESSAVLVNDGDRLAVLDDGTLEVTFE